MKIVGDSVTLVIAGAWNAAILSPIWVAKFGLNLEGQIPVTITAPMPAGAAINAPTSFKLPKLTYAVTQNSLILTPVGTDPEALELVHSAAKGILAALPHTPILGLGFNAAFEAENSEPHLNAFSVAQEDVIGAVPDEWTAAANSVRTSLSNDNSFLNVEKIFDSGAVRIQLNFHHPVTTAESAIALLDAQSFQGAFASAVDIAKRVLQEELGNDPDN